MRTLADRKNEQAKADADDRDLESRTDRRRQQDAHETKLKAMATRLCGMKPGVLGRLELDEQLLAAIATAQAIRSAPARNRQVNVVRQHLRALGAGLDALEQRLEAPTRLGVPREVKVAAPRPPSPVVLGWNARLADGGDAALAELLEEHPGADRQLLRQRMRELSRARAGASAAAITAAEVRLSAAIGAALAG
jgi:ribosome-associated protein